MSCEKRCSTPHPLRPYRECPGAWYCRTAHPILYISFGHDLEQEVTNLGTGHAHTPAQGHQTPLSICACTMCGTVARKTKKGDKEVEVEGSDGGKTKGYIRRVLRRGGRPGRGAGAGEWGLLGSDP